MLWKLVGNTFLQDVFLDVFGLVDSHLAVQGYEMFFQDSLPIVENHSSSVESTSEPEK